MVGAIVQPFVDVGVWFVEALVSVAQLAVADVIMKL